MDNQPHVRLVDAHSEGVGSCDHPELAGDEALLDALLGLGRQPGVEIVRRHLLHLQELRHLFGPPAGGAVNDGTFGRVRPQVRHQDLVDVRKLFATGGRNHHELEVRAPCSAVENGEFCPELFPEVPFDILDHVGLRGGGEAQDRRDRPRSRLLAYEAPHVAVVGPEVVPPSRQAVGFVQDPGADLALVQNAAEGLAAQLLRRDEHQARVPEPNPVQRFGSLGHRQQAVDGDTRPDAVCFQSGYLVRH